MALLTPPPTAPQRGDRTTFASRVDAFITWLINFVSELVSLVTNLNSIAAGGAYAIPFQVVAHTSISGVYGSMAFYGSTDQTSATALYLDRSNGGTDYTYILDSLTAGVGSAIKGHVRMQAMNDPSKWLLFRVSDYRSGGYYRILDVICIAGSSANPFAIGDNIMLFFQRTGDKGDQGLPGPNYCNLIAAYTLPSQAAVLDFTNVFTSAYDRYDVELSGLTQTSASALYVTLANAGMLDTNARYYNPLAHGGNLAGAGTASAFSFGVFSSADSSSMTVTLRFRNTNSPTKPKGFGVYGEGNLSVLAAEGAYMGGAVSGFRLGLNGGNFSAGTIRIFGFKNN